MSSRKLNALEQKIHQAVLAAPNATLSQKEIEGLASDAQARTAALNFLLGAGMFKALSDAKGRMVYRGVVKKELDVKKDMSGEEKMILGHIQASANEGIWTKHIKAKTELHQTVIDRCIKSLTQKQLIKAVKSVKYPTRKIFMMFHLDPSVEMTGGPWYTDNELDTEFIKLLCRACLQFIKDRSFPRARKTADDDAPTARRLYSISAAPAYPTSQQIQSFLSKSKITETELTVEHVEMLLNVLTLDGEVERLPAFGAALWSSNTYGDDENSDEETGKTKRKKEKERARKRKRSSHDGDDSDTSATSRKSKKSKSRKSRDDSSSESEEERRSSRKSSKKRRKGSDSSDSDDDANDGAEDAKINKRSGSKSKKRGRASTPPSDTSSDTLDSDSDEQSDPRAGRRTKSSSRRRSPAIAGDMSKHKADDGLEEAFGGAAHVYRALRPERAGTVVPSTFMSWSSQTPCARCSVFDFCKQGGPVNPDECEYYGDWLQRGAVQL